MKLILLGPPGAGKGTYGDDLSEKYGIPKVATGDILRDAVKDDAELGRKAKTYMEKGLLVQDDIMIEIIKERLAKDDCKNGFIFDGFPRTVVQAKSLDSILSSTDIKLDCVINIIVSDEVIIKRLSNRRICKNCGAIYNIVTLQSKKEGICDECGNVLYQRGDDKEEVIKNRIKVYYEQTAPLIEYYKAKGCIYDVVSNGNIQGMINRISSIIEKL